VISFRLEKFDRRYKGRAGLTERAHTMRLIVVPVRECVALLGTGSAQLKRLSSASSLPPSQPDWARPREREKERVMEPILGEPELPMYLLFCDVFVK
jgi:hypothetical protein